MTVYVDDMRAPFGRMIMCHMIADSTAELLNMADRIGVARRWIQHRGTVREHFDIARSKRALWMLCAVLLVTTFGVFAWELHQMPSWEGAPLFIVLNATETAIEFVLPEWRGCGRWSCALLTVACGQGADGAGYQVGAPCEAPPRSVSVFVGAP